MDLKRIVSLVLVLALVFSILAIPAQASAIGTGLLIGVSAASVVAASLIGLGISPGSDGSVFDGLVSDAVSHLQSLGFGDGVTIPVLKYIGTGSGIRYALQSAAMIALRSWLFSEDIVSADNLYLLPVGSPVKFSYYQYGNVTYDPLTFSIPVYCFYLTLGSSTYLVCFNRSSEGSLSGFNSEGVSVGIPKSSFYASWFDGSSVAVSYAYGNLTKPSDNSFITPFYSVSSSDYPDGIPSVIKAILNGSLLPTTSGFSSSFDVSLGDVASENSELSVGYPNWAIDSVQIDPDPNDPDDEPDLFIPVTLLPTYDETKAQTQDQAQTGDSSLETDNDGTSVDISGDVGGSITPGGGDLPEGESYPTVSDLTTMFAWLASSIDRSVELLFPDLQVIKTYLKTIAQWHETENLKYDSIISYLSGFDTDIDSIMTSLSNIDLDMDTLLSHASSSAGSLASIASDVADIRDVIADPLDADINEQEQDNKSAFLDNFSKKSQAQSIGDLSGLSDGLTDWFKMDADITSLFDQVDTGTGRWFTSETAQGISVGGGSAAVGVGLMDDVEYVPPDTPYLDAYTREVQDILAGGDGEW